MTKIAYYLDRKVVVFDYHWEIFDLDCCNSFVPQLEYGFDLDNHPNSVQDQSIHRIGAVQSVTEAPKFAYASTG